MDALRQTLALQSKVRRESQLVQVPVAELVPGDIIVLRLGDIVPADARLLGITVTGEETESELQIDQSALTGESLPVNKKCGDIVYSSSIVKQGQMLAVVVKTGANSFIGRAANLMAITTEPGHFQKVVNQIGNFLVLITVILVVIIFIVLVTTRAPGSSVLDIVRDVLVLAVAAIPIGLPTILSVTMAVGAKQLARKKVIIKRLTAVEEMASISILCSDKTGTLTLNELTFDKPYLCSGYSEEDILLYSYMASEPSTNDPIECAVRSAAKEHIGFLHDLPKTREHEIPGFKVRSFIPFNPTSKLTQASIKNLETGELFSVAKGAPQVIINLVGGDDDAVCAVNNFASHGLRALGVARTVDNNTKWKLIGMISLLDPPRPDSAKTIKECNNMGVAVKMITGDQQIIGKEVARRLGMNRSILDAQALIDPDATEEEIVRRCEHADGFAQVIPEHKFRVVQLLQEKGYLVGMTGDGVNDAPALKKANVGIAVHGCTDAARSAADIVLLAPGLSTILDGLETSRAIFQRMRGFALYQITTTTHFLLFFFIIILSEHWYLPAILLILIAVLNDAATLVISVDNVQISEHPNKWRPGQLITLSFIFGVCLAALSFGVYFVAKDVFRVSSGQLESIMYLNISSSPHFVIFSTRLRGYYWENLPSWTFIIAIIGTQIFAMLICIFGLLTAPISVGWGFSILAISLVYFMFLDVIKVQVLKRWSFSLTAHLWPTPARRRKLAQRRIQAAIDKRVHANVAKVRKVVQMLQVINAFKRSVGHSKSDSLMNRNDQDQFSAKT